MKFKHIKTLFFNAWPAVTLLILENSTTMIDSLGLDTSIKTVAMASASFIVPALTRVVREHTKSKQVK